MKIIKWLDEHFEETFLVILLILISCIEMIQVIFRNLPFVASLKWPEEFCRFCWIWTVFLSLPYTIRKGTMLRVNVLMDLLPQTARKIVGILVEAINAVVMFLLGYHSITVVGSRITSGELSTAMAWPMWIIYIIMVVGFFLGGIRALQMIVIHIQHFGERQLSSTEQTMADAAEEAAASKKAEGVNA